MTDTPKKKGILITQYSHLYSRLPLVIIGVAILSVQPLLFGYWLQNTLENNLNVNCHEVNCHLQSLEWHINLSITIGILKLLLLTVIVIFDLRKLKTQ